MTRIHQPIFPHLSPDLVGEIIDSGVAIHQKEVKVQSIYYVSTYSDIYRGGHTSSDHF